MRLTTLGLSCVVLVILGGLAAAQGGPEHVLVSGGFTAGSGVAGLWSSGSVAAAGLAPIGVATESCCGGQFAVTAGLFAQAGCAGVVPSPLLAAFELFGSATMGSAGVPVMSFAGTVDAQGAAVTLGVGGTAANASALLLIGGSEATTTLAQGSAALLIDLSTLLYPDVSAGASFLSTGEAGAVSAMFGSLPMGGIAGARVHAQWLILDPQSPVVDATLGGIALTRGLRIQF